MVFFVIVVRIEASAPKFYPRVTPASPLEGWRRTSKNVLVASRFGHLLNEADVDVVILESES